MELVPFPIKIGGVRVMGYVDEEGHPVCKNLGRNQIAEEVLKKAFGLKPFPVASIFAFRMSPVITIYGPLVLLNRGQQSLSASQVETIKAACDTVDTKSVPIRVAKITQETVEDVDIPDNDWDTIGDVVGSNSRVGCLLKGGVAIFFDVLGKSNPKCERNVFAEKLLLSVFAVPQLPGGLHGTVLVANDDFSDILMDQLMKLQSEASTYWLGRIYSK